MPPADLAYWMGKFVLEVRKKDGQEYLPKYIYVLVCCFKRYYEQHVVFDVNPLSSSDSRFGNFRVTLDSEMKIKREKENDPDSDSVICLALYIHYQLFSLENSCCCICAGQTNVLSHDLYLVHFATLTTLSHAVVCTCSWKSVHYLVIVHLSVL